MASGSSQLLIVDTEMLQLWILKCYNFLSRHCFSKRCKLCLKLNH